VRRHARDERSGTWDTFRALVLRDAPLAPGAYRYEDSGRLAAAVAADPGAVGFVGLPFVGECKALKIGDAGARPLRPTSFTVRTEDYLLTRRLYLYTPVAPSNPWVSKFVNFALSAEGQAVVEAAGFFGQELRRSPTAGEAEDRSDAPPEYRRLTAGAERLAVNFRFETGSNALDTKAQRDIGRLVERLASSGSGRGVALIGFADAVGEEELNLRLSRERAQAVAEELRSEGVEPATVTGFGEALPVADNESDEGRRRNRRVEVWVRR
jgi:phosphate transport system substrate-binding protein